MRVITAPENYVKEAGDICVFLAGGITKCKEWQKDIISRLEGIKETDHLVVFNPRRDNFDIKDPTATEKQIVWEFKMLEQCDIFSMYFCDSESDQPICFYELGRNIARIQAKYPTSWQDRIIITVEPGFKRAKDVYLQTCLAMGTNYKFAEDEYMHYTKISSRYAKFNNDNIFGN